MTGVDYYECAQHGRTLVACDERDWAAGNEPWDWDGLGGDWAWGGFGGNWDAPVPARTDEWVVTDWVWQPLDAAQTDRDVDADVARRRLWHAPDPGTGEGEGAGTGSMGRPARLGDPTPDELVADRYAQIETARQRGLAAPFHEAERRRAWVGTLGPDGHVLLAALVRDHPCLGLDDAQTVVEAVLAPPVTH